MTHLRNYSIYLFIHLVVINLMDAYLPENLNGLKTEIGTGMW